MNEERTREFAQSGTGIVDVDGTKLHARWRLSGTQQYVVGAGSAIDGHRSDISLALYFDNLPAEMAVVQDLLDRIAADCRRPITVDLGRSNYPGLYCREVRTESSGNPSGIVFSDELTQNGGE
jgi:hypothetical protein